MLNYNLNQRTGGADVVALEKVVLTPLNRSDLQRNTLYGGVNRSFPGM